MLVQKQTHVRPSLETLRNQAQLLFGPAEERGGGMQPAAAQVKDIRSAGESPPVSSTYTVLLEIMEASNHARGADTVLLFDSCQ